MCKVFKVLTPKTKINPSQLIIINEKKQLHYIISLVFIFLKICLLLIKRNSIAFALKIKKRRCKE